MLLCWHLIGMMKRLNIEVSMLRDFLVGWRGDCVLAQRQTRPRDSPRCSQRGGWNLGKHEPGGGARCGVMPMDLMSMGVDVDVFQRGRLQQLRVVVICVQEEARQGRGVGVGVLWAAVQRPGLGRVYMLGTSSWVMVATRSCLSTQTRRPTRVGHPLLGLAATCCHLPTCYSLPPAATHRNLLPTHRDLTCRPHGRALKTPAARRPRCRRPTVP